MYVYEAERHASAQLGRVQSALCASVVETKLRRLESAFKANFDPSQPRVPAGRTSGISTSALMPVSKGTYERNSLWMKTWLGT